MNGVRSPESGPDEVAALLVSQLRRHLGDAIESVIAHGSWIHGDFAPERSDLDLLVVLSADPDQGVVESVSPIVDHATSRYPCWHDRLEIGIVSAQGVADVLAGAPSVPVVRISPGEPLHLTQGDRHRLFDWEAARRGRALAGKEPIQVLPDIPPTVLRGWRASSFSGGQSGSTESMPRARTPTTSRRMPSSQRYERGLSAPTATNCPSGRQACRGHTHSQPGANSPLGRSAGGTWSERGAHRRNRPRSSCCFSPVPAPDHDIRHQGTPD